MKINANANGFHSSDIKVILSLLYPGESCYSVIKVSVDKGLHYQLVGSNKIDESVGVLIWDAAASMTPHSFINEHFIVSQVMLDEVPFGFTLEQFCLVKNTDGSSRWLVSKKSGIRSALHLFNATLFRTKMLSALLKVFGFLGIAELYFKDRLYIYKRIPTFIDKQLSKFYCDKYAVYFGVRGDEQKAVVALIKNNNAFKFLKIPVAVNSSSLLSNECKALEFLKSIKISAFGYPAVEALGRAAAFESLIGRKTSNKASLNGAHYRYFNELSSKTIHSTKLGDSDFFKDIETSLDSINELSLKPILKPLYTTVSNIMLSINRDVTVQTAFAHGDFTPWNMYSNGGVISVYDWEMSRPAFPLHYDLIHFVFQTNILVYKRKFNEFLSDIGSSIKDSRLDEGRSTNSDLSILLYLLVLATKYIVVFDGQKERLVEQSFWLLAAWEDALVATSNNRTDFFESSRYATP